MQSHVKILAVLHIVFACIGILIGLGLFIFFGGLATLVAATDHGPDSLIGTMAVGGIGAFLLVLLIVLSLPGLIAGIALLYLKPWGKILGIIVSALDLLSFPFGTALGIYGLWVLVNPETDRLFSAAQPVVRTA